MLLAICRLAICRSWARETLVETLLLLPRLYIGIYSCPPPPHPSNKKCVNAARVQIADAGFMMMMMMMMTMMMMMIIMIVYS
jgi:hypothetical protein